MGKAARLNAARKRDYCGESDKVVVGYVHPAEVLAVFHLSMAGLLMREHAKHLQGLPTHLLPTLDRQGNPVSGGGHVSEFSSANVANARNKVVKHFLSMGGSPDWLWFVDADMKFEPDVVDRLVASAYVDGERKADIVGGLCFGLNQGNLFPTLYALTEKPDGGGVGVVRYDEYPEDVMFQVAATGAACLLIHRSVLERMHDHGFNKAYPWFQETELNGIPCGEDFTFCLRAGALGVAVWVNTGIKIGHHKSWVLVEDQYLEQRKAVTGG